MDSNKSQRRFTVLKSHLLVNSHDDDAVLLNCVNARSRSLFAEEDVLSTIPSTKSFHELRAFHGTSNSLSSRMLRCREKNFFNNGAIRVREATWRELAKDIYRIDPKWSVDEYRQNLDTQFREFVKTGLMTVERVNEELYSFFGVLEGALVYDISFTAKMVVHFQLYGCCVYRLGTERHKYLFRDANLVKDLGCFAMTEVAHGSNVQAIGTTATYDKQSKEFIINTPDMASTKFWIGNAAVYGTKAVVFCQLQSDNTQYGVHAILCPLRNQDTMEITPGVTIRDCGVKQGWNAVDNGAIRFDNVRVPRENLLNRYGDIAEDGSYASPIKSPGKRFAVTLSALMFGRLLYIVGPTKALEMGLTISVRYALQRKQFGPPKKAENLIWKYPTHKEKLVPLIAIANAFQAISIHLSERFHKISDEDMGDLHADISGVKAYISEFVPPALQIIRGCCGGHGYSENNRIGRIMNDMDVFMTAEGDSTVLYQQLSRHLVGQYAKQFSGNKFATAISFAFQKSKLMFEEMNPFIVRNTSEAHLRDIKFHLQAFAFRSGVKLHTASTKLFEMRKQLKDPIEAWNASLSELTELSKAYVHLEILKKFAEFVQQCEDQEAKRVYTLLCSIYAIHNIVNDMGFFRTNEYIKSKKAKALKTLLYQLYEEVDQFIPSIIDSFNIPDFLLRSPIGLKNMQYVPNTLERIEFPLF